MSRMQQSNVNQDDRGRFTVSTLKRHLAAYLWFCCFLKMNENEKKSANP